jgi:Fic family protein
MVVAIDEWYRELTGEKAVSAAVLDELKDGLAARARKHRNVAKEILEHPDLRDEFVLKLTYHSNSIEGSTLTEPDTAAVLFDGVALPNHSLAEQMEAKNHQAAIMAVLDYVVAGGTLDEAFVLRLHGILMNGILSDAGFYRRHAVRIVGANVPTANYVKLPDLIPPLMDEADRASRDVLSAAAAVHARFEQIHPFGDGNGRVGRLLMTAMLLKANWAPAVICQEQKRLYYAYLNKAQVLGDHSNLEKFLGEAIGAGFDLLERV